MRIVVVDSHTLNPGDLSWGGLRELGECTVYERTPPELTAERARGAGAVITNKVVMDRTVIEQLPELQYIGVTATGYNMVDVEAASERGIPVANVPTYGTDSVAEMVFAHLLELARRVGYHAQTVREGRWAESPDFAYWDYPQIELAGRTMGVVGLGRIGRRVAAIATAFDMRVLAYDVQPPETCPESIVLADLETLLCESDVVSLHVPLTPDTEGLLDADRLSLMKPTAFLINTSRGPVVDERALADALENERLAGAGLDVVAQEPPDEDCPLLTAPNCLITPHMAWATAAARQRLMDTTVANLRAFLRGEPQNVVNDPV